MIGGVPGIITITMTRGIDMPQDRTVGQIEAAPESRSLASPRDSVLTSRGSNASSGQSNYPSNNRTSALQTRPSSLKYDTYSSNGKSVGTPTVGDAITRLFPEGANNDVGGFRNYDQPIAVIPGGSETNYSGILILLLLVGAGFAIYYFQKGKKNAD